MAETRSYSRAAEAAEKVLDKERLDFEMHKRAAAVLDIGMSAMRESVSCAEGGRWRRFRRALARDFGWPKFQEPEGTYAQIGFDSSGWGLTEYSLVTPTVAHPSFEDEEVLMRMRGYNNRISGSTHAIRLDTLLSDGTYFSHGQINSYYNPTSMDFPRVRVHGEGIIDHKPYQHPSVFYYELPWNPITPDSPRAEFIYQAIQDMAEQLDK